MSILFLVSPLSGCVRSDGLDDINDSVGISVLENSIKSARVEVGIGRLIEFRGLNRAILTEVVDNQIHKLNLCGVEPVFV